MSPKRIALLSAGLGGLAVLVLAAWLFSAALDARKAKAGGGGAPAEASPGERRPLPPYRMANLDQQEIPADELRRGRVQTHSGSLTFSVSRNRYCRGSGVIG